MLFRLFGYYPWHYGVMDLLDLGWEALIPLGPCDSVVILYEGLRVYSKTLDWFSLCAGYPNYILYLWFRIPLYTVVTLSNFCKDLMHLKLDIL